MLALVEGWVDEVVTQATAQWMPSAVALAELCAGLVPPEVRGGRSPRWWDLSCGRAGCVMLQTCRGGAAPAGSTARDAVWSHPDLVPTSADLDDPLGFVAGETRTEGEETGDFDTALEELLKGESTEGDENPNS